MKKTVQVHASIEQLILPSICAYICFIFLSLYSSKKPQATRTLAHLSCSFSIISLPQSNAFTDSEYKDILTCNRIYLFQVTAGIHLLLQLRQQHRRPQLYGNQPLNAAGTHVIPAKDSYTCYGMTIRKVVNIKTNASQKVKLSYCSI